MTSSVTFVQQEKNDVGEEEEVRSVSSIRKYNVLSPTQQLTAISASELSFLFSFPDDQLIVSNEP